MYEVTVVHGAGKGEVMWPGLEVIADGPVIMSCSVIF